MSNSSNVCGQRDKSEIAQNDNKHIKYFIIFLYVILGLLFAALFGVMFSDNMECFIGNLVGLAEKNEILKFIGWGISGLIAFLVAVSLILRTHALDEQNRIIRESIGVQRNLNEIQQKNNDEQNKLVEKGHAQERFKAATEHLGSDATTARIASFYEFYNLTQDNPNFRKNIFDILCAHFRHITREDIYQNIKVENKSENEKIKPKITSRNEPTEEMESLLNVLFKEGKNVFGDMTANLKKGYFINADLRKACLKNANLTETHLEHVQLSEANLEGALLKKARLSNAKLLNANLEKAELNKADLTNADLKGANLEGADLTDAILIKANLKGTKISSDTKMPKGWEKVVRVMPNGTENNVEVIEGATQKYKKDNNIISKHIDSEYFLDLYEELLPSRE